MSNNLDVIRAMFRSLAAGVRNARGKKIYKFSELRDSIAKENVDVSGFNLRRKADQQALLSVAEKCIYDLERENRIQADIQEFEDVVNNESDYPDIPLTYGWQFEGVDNSEDCFLYPTTPLTCDVLSGQCCDLSMVTKNVYDNSGEVAGTIVFGDPIVGHIVPESNRDKPIDISATLVRKLRRCAYDVNSERSRSCGARVQRVDKKSDNFYTPQTILDRVVQCLGVIDLDPCADPKKIIPAQNHYTFDGDGLSKEWHGKIFMNPPYSKPALWVDKLQQEYEQERLTEAIALLPASTDTKWLSPLLRSNLCCFWKGRIRFIDGATYQPAKHSARESHVLVYWGSRFERFIDSFQDVASFPNVQVFKNIQSNRSKTAVSNKGFGQIKPIQVKSASIPMPYIGEIVGYHPNNQKSAWLDLDDLTENLEVSFSPELEKVKVQTVKPSNGKYKGQIRRAIRVEASTKIIKLACDLGNWKAQKLYHEMITHCTKEAGIKDAVLVNGRIIPRDESGNFLEDLAFDTTIPNLLIDDWLLVENYLKHDSEADVSDVTDLEMLVNLLVASVSGRKESIIKRCAAIEFFQGLYPSSNIDEINQLERFLSDLQTDDELYRILCLDMVSEIRKQSLIDPLKLPKQIRECTEIKEIIVSKASKNPNVRLINNWLHRAAETHKGIPGTNGEAHCNTWQFASMVCGAATGRAPNTNTEAGLQMMIDLNVISFPNSTALQRAKVDDSIYLQLLGAVKEAMDLKVQEAFNRE